MFGKVASLKQFNGPACSEQLDTCNFHTNLSFSRITKIAKYVLYVSVVLYKLKRDDGGGDRCKTKRRIGTCSSVENYWENLCVVSHLKVNSKTLNL